MIKSKYALGTQKKMRLMNLMMQMKWKEVKRFYFKIVAGITIIKVNKYNKSFKKRKVPNRGIYQGKAQKLSADRVDQYLKAII